MEAFQGGIESAFEESVEREEESNANGNAIIQEAPTPINVDVDQEFPNESSIPLLEPIIRPCLRWRITSGDPASFPAVDATTQAKLICW